MRVLAVSLLALALAPAEASEDATIEAASLLQVAGRKGNFQAAGPDSGTSREEVNAIWDSMRNMWPHPGPAKDAGCTINMDMRDNTMTMDNTKFTLPDTRRRRKASLLHTDADAEEADEADDAGELASKEADFGSFRVSKNMKGNLMTMKDSRLVAGNGKTTKDALTVLEDMQKVGDTLLQTGAERLSAPEVPVSDQNLYMYNSKLSMDGTVFTMNVGTGATTASLAQTSASSVTVDKLNINMYMHGNQMSMTGKTDFSMDVTSPPQPGVIPETVEEAGVQAADIARLVLLSISSFRDAAQDSSVLEKPAESNELQSIWQWLESWTTSADADTGLNINMYMYENQMNMDDTVFKMNVGGAAVSLAEQAQASGEVAAKQSKMNPAAGSNAQDMYLYDAEYNMKDTELTIGVSSLLQTNANRTSSGTYVNMYMYKNSMDMKDTYFTMNVGSGSQSLVQTGETDGAAGKMARVMNVNSLNINMFMLENDMQMKNTFFSWTIS